MNASSSNGHVLVYVTLPKLLSRYNPNNGAGGSFTVTLQKGSTLRDLVSALEMPHDLPELFFVNDRRCTAEGVLPNAAQVQIFPSLSA